jgi:hypothetical protein
MIISGNILKKFIAIKRKQDFGRLLGRKYATLQESIKNQEKEDQRLE